MKIAIDGPAAAGKSTVAKIVAEKLQYTYIDTGAMYRALTFAALQAGADVEDEAALMAILTDLTIALVREETGQFVYVNGENVSELVRSPEVTANVSAVAKHGLVREEMVKRQQQFAVNGKVVMDGRDIGTHVMPDAELKLFMIASVDERAERRHKENVAKGFASDLAQLKAEIAERDRYDSTREVAPLTQAADAVLLDTTGRSIDDVVAFILERVAER